VYKSIHSPLRGRLGNNGVVDSYVDEFYLSVNVDPIFLVFVVTD
jgi:hypothetical protein